MKYIRYAILPALFIGATLSSTAQTDGTGESSRTHAVSVTLSTIPLIEPVVQVTAEWNVHEDIGFAAYLGAGGDGGPAVGAGVQVAWYLLGDFDHGLQIGGDLLYAFVDRNSITDTYEGEKSIGVGPFVGYKLILPFGFTLNLQGGARFTISKDHIEEIIGRTLYSYYHYGEEILPIVNVNVGWSF